MQSDFQFIDAFQIRHWLNFKIMNGNDLVQWVIYIQMKIMLGKDLVKLEIFMKTKTIIGNDQVKVRYIFRFRNEKPQDKYFISNTVSMLKLYFSSRFSI